MNESFDPARLRMGSIHQRKHLVDTSHFVQATDPPGDLLSGMPDLLAGKQLKTLCRRIAQAKRENKPVVMAMGAHVIKCGLSLLVKDLMERRIVTALAFNGAGAIHDWEIAYAGATSEQVADTLGDGSFGMVHETPKAMSEVVDQAARQGRGFGEILGAILDRSEFPYKEFSLFAAAHRFGVPATVHVCIGCDTVHMAAGAKGAHIGEASLNDFKVLTRVVAGLEGGVWLNIGSAVVLPEVFMKALTVSRNLTGSPKKFTAADLDMFQHFRPRQNVLSRPGGEGLALTGHHEIMIPLLRWGVLSELARGK
ncbi:MAG: hypothetical protein KJ645_09995 [Planctomycetes bacterium]|nr:hypothetical protein [Planctomycetota bacterium]